MTDDLFASFSNATQQSPDTNDAFTFTFPPADADFQSTNDNSNSFSFTFTDGDSTETGFTFDVPESEATSSPNPNLENENKIPQAESNSLASNLPANNDANSLETKKDEKSSDNSSSTFSGSKNSSNGLNSTFSFPFSSENQQSLQNDTFSFSFPTETLPEEKIKPSFDHAFSFGSFVDTGITNKKTEETQNDAKETQNDANETQNNANETQNDVNETQNDVNETHNDANETQNDVNETHNDVNETQNDVNETQNDANETQNDVNETHNDANETQNDVNETHNDVNETQNDVNETQNDVNETQNDANETQNDANETQNDVNETHNDANETQNDVNETQNDVNETQNDANETLPTENQPEIKQELSNNEISSNLKIYQSFDQNNSFSAEIEAVQNIETNNGIESDEIKNNDSSFKFPISNSHFEESPSNPNTQEFENKQEQKSEFSFDTFSFPAQKVEQKSENISNAFTFGSFIDPGFTNESHENPMEGENETNANNEKDEESNEESNEETDDKSEITNDDKEDEKIYGNNSVFTFPVCQSQENQVQETNNDVFGSFVDDSFQENTITENSENNIQQKEESTPNNSVVVDSSSFSFPTSQTNDEQQLDDQSQNTSNDFSFGSFVDSGITNTSKEQDIKETSEIEIDNEQSQPTEHLNSTLTCFPLQQNEQKQESASSEIIFDEESTSFVDKEIQENNPESPNFTFPKEEQENPSNNFSSPSFPNSKEKKEYGHESFSFGFTDPASSSKTVEDSSTKHDSEFEGIVFTKGNETNVNLSFKFTDVSDNSNTENVIEGVPSQNDKIDSENKPIENVNEFIFVDSSMKENESSERITNDGGSASINNEDIDVVEEEYQANDNEIPINSEQIAVQNSTDQPFSFDFNSGSVCDNSSFSFTFPVEGESDSNNQSSFSFTFPPECESVTTDSPNNSSFSFTFPSQESEQGNTTSNDTKNEPIQNQIVKKTQIEQKSEISENNDTHTNTMKNDVNNESTHDNGGSFNPFASPPPPTDLSKTSSEGNLKLDFSKAASTDTLFSKNGTSSSISSSLSGSSSNFNPFSTQFPAQNVSPTNYKFEDFLSMTKAPVFDVKRENLHTYFLKNDPKDSVEASFAFLLSQK